MEIRLYNFSKKRNSTKTITNEQYISFNNVTLKHPTSTKNPVFILTGAISTSYNYLYVVKWNRYYFIDEKTSMNNDTYALTCSIDALATFKNDIMNYTAFVERSASHYSMEFNDPAISPEQTVDYTSSAETQILQGSNGHADPKYYVRMLSSGSTGVKTYLTPNLNNWGQIFNPLFDNPGSLSISDYIYAYICDPSKYVISVSQGPIGETNVADYPYLAISTANVVGETVKCGWFTTGVGADRILKRELIKTFTLNKPTSMYGNGDFRTFSPTFSNLIMFLPGMGTVTISPDLLRSTLTLKCIVDTWTGDIMYMLYANSKLVSTYDGCLYSSCQIGDGGTGGAGSLLRTGERITGDVVTGNIISAPGDVIEGVKSVVSPTPSIVGNTGGFHNGIFSNVVLSLRQRQSGGIPRIVYGSPCHAWHTLGGLSGYCKCQLASLQIACEGDILDEINTMLNSGFYIE